MMIDTWLKLKIFLGLARQPEEVTETVQDVRPTTSVAVAPVTGGSAPGAWGISFETALTGLRGQMIVPTAPGQYQWMTFQDVQVGELVGRMQYMAQLAEQWQAAGNGQPFDGQVILEGAGWHLQAIFGEPADQVLYQIDGPAKAPVAGRATQEGLVWALMLWPDCDAVAAYLELGRRYDALAV